MKPWVALLVLAGCARHLGPDRLPDTEAYTRARTVALVDGVADTEGAVSYPDGHRLEWLAFHLPEDHVGRFEVTLDARRVRMRVYDQWGEEQGCCWAATIERASGTVYALVYARHRGGAGTYRVHAVYTPEPPPPDYASLEVPPPPDLAAVPPLDAIPPPPDAIPTCDPDHIDSTNPACVAVMCAKGFGCPEGPETPDHIDGEIISVDTFGSGTAITMNRGTNDGVAAGWKGEIIGLDGSDFRVIKVTAKVSVARLTLEKKVVQASGMTVRLSGR